MASEYPTRDTTGHRRVLGACWIAYGIICLITALLMVVYTGTATVMFGALLSRGLIPSL